MPLVKRRRKVYRWPNTYIFSISAAGNIIPPNMTSSLCWVQLPSVHWELEVLGTLVWQRLVNDRKMKLAFLFLTSHVLFEFSSRGSNSKNDNTKHFPLIHNTHYFINNQISYYTMSPNCPQPLLKNPSSHFPSQCCFIVYNCIQDVL